MVYEWFCGVFSYIVLYLCIVVMGFFFWPFVDLHKSIARQSCILCSQVSCVHLKLCVFLMSVVSRIG